MRSKYLLVGALLLVVALALAACQSAAPQVATTAPQAAQPTQAQQACPTNAPAPECPAPPTPVVQDVPFQDQWSKSPHADAAAEAFVHWDNADPKEVPVTCAKCHSTPGYLDFLGADGSAPQQVDKAAPIGTVITCVACHNPATATLTSVTFPSGLTVDGLGPSARCAQCHQGRESTTSVNAAIEKAGAQDQLDTVSGDIGFINIHYFAAAATLYGTQAKGGYEYEGQTYDPKFEHVPGFDSCIGCHDQHTLEVRVDSCKGCHTNVNTVEDLKNVRMASSAWDYDGDGNVTEGIAGEIQGLQEKLLASIQTYAKEKAGGAIAYNADAYPYFYIDTNGNGTVDTDEANADNKFATWTPRLLKAAYNYQTSIKDPGSFAHNGKYIIELLYDSIADLNEQVSSKVDMATLHRTDPGHFAATEEAFRHWDAEESGLVPATCVKCHTSEGLPMFLANNATIAQPPSNSLHCETCHSDLATFTRFEVKQVTMPSGKTVSFDNADANLCLSCHQGRESKVSMDRAITASGLKANQVATADQALSFRNPHYFAAGATVFGTQAQGMYEFQGKQYNGQFQHVDAFNTCVECHNVHALTVQTDKCQACHGSTDPATYRNPSGDTTDYDGDGDTKEGIAGEVATMRDKLFAAMQAYVAKTQGADPILYDAARYPYFFADANKNGSIDQDEKAYTTWTPELLKAGYNYQWVTKDPGAFAHNGKYVLQVLYDSIEQVGGDLAGTTRPAVTAPAAATPAP